MSTPGNPASPSSPASTPAPGTGTRIEKDSMGEMPVPADALYGASTARAVDNFPISFEPVPAAVIHAFGHLKAACAQANKDLGKLDPVLAAAIIAASNEVAKGKHDAHFPVDIYQTGSGTSTNMNANEVIANLANQKLGAASASPRHGADNAADPAAGLRPRLRVHQNDHVNMGQSSNDTFPTAMNIAVVMAIKDTLLPALKRLGGALEDKAKAWDTIVKIGRTHLMDATPVRVGQVFGGYADQVHDGHDMVRGAMGFLARRMPIGGTAVGTGINTHPEFAGRVCDELNNRMGLEGDTSFAEAKNHFAAQSARDGFVAAHASLKATAVALSKIANDIRHLGSGPRAGLGELTLPETQPGSSIMPGKVNPVICESVMQVVCRVVGNDATVTMAGMGGVGSLFELNVAMPVMIDAFLESVKLLANASNMFVDKLLTGLVVNEQRCFDLLDGSLMTITALAPEIGYDKCAALAKQAHKENKTVRQIVAEQNLMTEARLNELMDYDAMTRPDKE